MLIIQTMPNLPKKLIYSAATVAAVGILLGAFFALRGDVQPAAEAPSTTNVSSDSSNTFGGSFSNFILGRSADGSAIGKDTPLVRASKFYAGEKVGLRAQTSSEAAANFEIELRFLSKETGEETAGSQASRQKFSIKTGLHTYCCLVIPKEAGSFTLAILRNNAFIGTLGGIAVVPAKAEQGGSLFGL